jgi:hypothetical protein
MALEYPSERIIARLVNEKLVAYEKANAHLFCKSVLSNEEQEQRMSKAKSILHEASEISDFDKFAKNVNKAKRILSEKDVAQRPQVGEKVKKLIDVLRYKVMHEIKELETVSYTHLRAHET